MSESCFIAPEDGYYFASATVTSTDPPVSISLFLAKWTSSQTEEDAMGVANGTGYAARNPTTGAIVSSTVFLNAGDRLAVGVRNATSEDSKTAAYTTSPQVPVSAQNLFVVYQLP